MNFRKKRLEKAINMQVSQWLINFYDELDIKNHVALTGVVVADDLSYVKLYVHWQQLACCDKFMSILNKNSYKVRKIIAASNSLKRVPSVRFYYDKDQDDFQELCHVMTELSVN